MQESRNTKCSSPYFTIVLSKDTLQDYDKQPGKIQALTGNYPVKAERVE